MIEYELILEKIAKNSYKNSIEEHKDIDFDIFKQLFDAQLVSALDATTDDGGCFVDPKITFKGREYLDNMNNKISNPATPIINIGSMNNSPIQIGDKNNMTANITISDLVEKVSKTDDQNAKSILKELLNNATVSTLIGIAASSLISML